MTISYLSSHHTSDTTSIIYSLIKLSVGWYTKTTILLASKFICFIISIMDGLYLCLYKISPSLLPWILLHLPSTRMLHHLLPPLSLNHYFFPFFTGSFLKSIQIVSDAFCLKKKKKNKKNFLNLNNFPFLTPILLQIP